MTSPTDNTTSATTTTEDTTNSTKTSFKYGRPVVPSLYFDEKRSSSSLSSSSSIPSELFASCVEFCDWGDLAKLACVQKSWSDILEQAANTSSQSKWELAQALMNGHCGLDKNLEKGVSLLKDLAQLPIDETTGKPIMDVREDENAAAAATASNNEDSETSTTTAATTVTSTPTDSAGYAPAIRQLADCYLVGKGVQRDAQCAVAWLEASYHVGGDADAAHEVAIIREYGRHGIEVDVVAAATWFHKAAEAGHVDSMTELGLCYELGCGVEQSDEKSLDWYTKAANLGHATAKFSVGEAFEEARGVPQSDQEAVLWYHSAALDGDDDSKKALRRLYDIARIVVPGVADILRD